MKKFNFLQLAVMSIIILWVITLFLFLSMFRYQYCLLSTDDRLVMKVDRLTSNVEIIPVNVKE